MKNYIKSKCAHNITKYSIACCFTGLALMSVNLEAANCNIINEWKVCTCRVTQPTSTPGVVKDIKEFNMTIGGWADCGTQGCTRAKGGVGSSYDVTTRSAKCVPK